MIIVFDLDDTLYKEITYVKSGFREVDLFLKKEFGLKPSYNFMVKTLKEFGRGEIFNKVLEKNDLKTKTNIKKCISVYRNHKPLISLSKNDEKCLKYLRNYNKYIVTDGNKIVQKNKIEALGIASYFKKIYFTSEYGLKNAKPSPYCFNKIKELEKCYSEEIVYIGDNPYKDFVGIKPLGIKTIRILQGEYKNTQLRNKFEADKTIKSLSELKGLL